jgi:hypothetical protein
MSQSPSPSNRTPLRQQVTPGRLALAAIVLVITLVLALVLRDFVRNSIVLPLVNFFWIVWIAILSVHQAIWWILLLGIGGMVAVRSLRLPGMGWTRPGPSRGRGLSVSRYEYWHHGLESQALSPFSRERIRRDLQGLVLKVLATQLRTETSEVRERLQAGAIELPGSVADLFVFTPPPLFEPAGRWDWLTSRFRRPIRAAGLNVEPILAWLEAQTNVEAPDETENSTTETQKHRENLY